MKTEYLRYWMAADAALSHEGLRPVLFAAENGLSRPSVYKLMDALREVGQRMVLELRPAPSGDQREATTWFRYAPGTEPLFCGTPARRRSREVSMG